MTAKNSNPTFSQFAQAIRAQFAAMQKSSGDMFRVNVEKDVIWESYLAAFPEGTNNIFKERREYDCNCCKNFIRNVGGLVTVKDGKLVSIWDIKIGGYYQVVTDALKSLIENAKIADLYLHFESKVGVEATRTITDSGEVLAFNHFSLELPRNVVRQGAEIASELGKHRSNFDVLKRSLVELSRDATETVLDLIAQGSLYRGEEKKWLAEKFLAMQIEFSTIQSETAKDIYVWQKSRELGDNSKVRNDALGTLLIDLSEGMDLEDAVKRWEKVMAPTNYKRPTALITPAMISAAQAKIEELGLSESLSRRYAVIEDLTINNLLFADRSARKAMNVFDELKASTSTVSKKSLDKVEEVSIETFLKDILPKADTIEVLLENRHTNNLVSVVAPATAGAPGLFKWKSGFSWSYNGEVTDSIKERVKAAGGNVSGDFRISLSWFNKDDLDLWVYEPDNAKIYYGHAVSHTSGGKLDVDMNAYGKKDDFNPVENVVWEKESTMREGKYRVVVNNYNRRMTDRIGFIVEVEHKGEIHTFTYNRPAVGETTVVEFTFDRKKGLVIGKNIGHTKATKEVWGVNTEQFQKVTAILNSPNHWDGEETGNKHTFFILEGCKNPVGTRGFYNEYLSNELAQDHRKVFEVLGSKLKVEPSDNQLSGVGFSSTQRNSVLVRVTGSFTRTVKVNF